jgi:hypothetical protein
MPYRNIKTGGLRLLNGKRSDDKKCMEMEVGYKLFENDEIQTVIYSVHFVI